CRRGQLGTWGDRLRLGAVQVGRGLDEEVVERGELHPSPFKSIRGEEGAPTRAVGIYAGAVRPVAGPAGAEYGPPERTEPAASRDKGDCNGLARRARRDRPVDAAGPAGRPRREGAPPRARLLRRGLARDLYARDHEGA